MWESELKFSWSIRSSVKHNNKREKLKMFIAKELTDSMIPEDIHISNSVLKVAPLILIKA